MLCGLLDRCWRFRYRLGVGGSVSVVEFSLEGPLLHSLADRTHLSETLRVAGT